MFLDTVEAGDGFVLRFVDEVAELADARVFRDERGDGGGLDGDDVGLAADGAGLKVDALGGEGVQTLRALVNEQRSGVILV